MGRTFAVAAFLAALSLCLAGAVAGTAAPQQTLEALPSDRNAPAEDPEKRECDGFRNWTTPFEKCSYIQKYCEDDGLWKPLEVYYCKALPHNMGWPLIVASLLWLYVLFLVLGATADNFFSPILTQLSQDLGLPPRFAGVTFLALGNGAPDVSSTISAVKGGDYNLSLGSLTGAGMFVGTVVAGSCILKAGSAKCRGALVRDVLGYAVAIITVLCILASGQVGMLQVGLLFIMYFSFVLSVLGADLWHRLVHLKRFPATQDTATSPRRPLASEVEIGGGASAQPINGNPDYAHMPANRYRDLAWATMSRSASFFKRVPSLKALRDTMFRTGALSGSFMRDSPSNLGLSHTQTFNSIAEDIAGEEDSESEEEVAQAQVEVHERLLHRASAEDSSSDGDGDCDCDKDGDEGTGDARQGYVAPTSEADEETGGLLAPTTSLNLMQRGSGSTDSSTPSLTHTRRPPDWDQRSQPIESPFAAASPHVQTWATLADVDETENQQDTVWARPPSAADRFFTALRNVAIDMWNGLFMESWDEIEDMSLYEKSSLILMMPFTIVQRATIPIMVPENYCKPWLVLSITLCPVWLMYFTGNWGAGAEVWLIVMGAAIAAAALAAATSERDVPPDWSCGTRILIGAAMMCVVGFVVAASWISLVADQLVSMIQFFGYLSGVDSAVLGLTVLAWGNSLGDLSTNVAMAKRGLSNMALTACFAGPLFNILVGMSVGFALWLRNEGVSAVPVEINTSVLIGGLFIVSNCACLVALGLFNGRRVPSSHGYLMFGIYGLYIAVSLTMLAIS